MKVWLVALMVLLAGCGAEASEPADVIDVGAQPTTTTALAGDPTELMPDMDHQMSADMDHDMSAVMDHDMDQAESDPASNVAEPEHGEDMAAMDHAVADDGAAITRTIEIVMTEWAFSPDPIEIVAGETVEFVVRNDGTADHEFRVTTTENVEHHIAEGHTGHDETMDGVLLLEPGATGTLIVTFHEVGEFDVIACLIPDHYEFGMHAELTVGE